MSAPDPVRQLVLEWISYAQGDMSAARTLANHRADNVPATSAFHAHQAVEKAIKALLIAAQVPFQKEHDLSLLKGLGKRSAAGGSRVQRVPRGTAE